MNRCTLPPPQDAADALERTFLEIRSKLLDLGAALDRIERGGGAEALKGDLRLVNIRAALAVLQEEGPNRAERVQRIFSNDYDPAWQRPEKVLCVES